uniref:TIL domain-containing protein n=1 Tax=Panagrolaimus davidi TaxID=227884 RepID=A0A914PAQ7_9BILA
MSLFSVNAQLCPPNESWSACATPCPATCSQILPSLCVLPCMPACVCNLGFVRDEFSGFCVSVLECLAGPPLLLKK